MQCCLVKNQLNLLDLVIHRSLNVYMKLLYFVLYGPHAQMSFQAPIFDMHSLN
jgi:hypothetical protein